MKSQAFHAELARAGAMSRGRWGRLAFLIRRYPLGAIGGVILAVFVFAAALAPLLTHVDAVSTDALVVFSHEKFPPWGRIVRNEGGGVCWQRA